MPLQTPGCRGRLPWAHIPKQKEPPHRGDIGWGRFPLCQFVFYHLAFDLNNKLSNNSVYSMIFNLLSWDPLHLPWSMDDLESHMPTWRILVVYSLELVIYFRIWAFTVHFTWVPHYFSHLSPLLSPILGITKEIMSRGPQVLEMEYREPYWLELGLGWPIFSSSMPPLCQ